MTRRRRVAALVAALGLLLGVSGTAFAGTAGNQSPASPPSEEEVQPPEGGVAGATGPEEEEPTLDEAVTGALPFTGFQAVIVLGAGAGIAATGFALRRLGRRTQD